ncbi:hypothetical protein ACVWXO_002801 [Bradyrhizobium sp. LM2.7]
MTVSFDMRRRIGDESQFAILALAACSSCSGLYSEANAPFTIDRSINSPRCVPGLVSSGDSR